MMNNSWTVDRSLREKKEKKYPDIAPLIGENVLRFRKAAGKTQQELAEEAEISIRHLSDIENGVTNASMLTLENLSKALHVELEALIRPSAEQSFAADILTLCDKYSLDPRCMQDYIEDLLLDLQRTGQLETYLGRMRL